MEGANGRGDDDDDKTDNLVVAVGSCCGDRGDKLTLRHGASGCVAELSLSSSSTPLQLQLDLLLPRHSAKASYRATPCFPWAHGGQHTSILLPLRLQIPVEEGERVPMLVAPDMLSNEAVVEVPSRRRSSSSIQVYLVLENMHTTILAVLQLSVCLPHLSPDHQAL
ncbi:hypothetical protein GUJ93_ZPchr0002g24483 [Zizania palustris]|uniref:Uncharacterized protein n=1 Tax=Zizania palustris TaxID=103762 RepID=A0A8J5S5E4_ZIZPA|nr:hypothetical protein GUJ93_ZPchr0002g24483 [Zizania palustris]